MISRRASSTPERDLDIPDPGEGRVGLKYLRNKWADSFANENKTRGLRSWPLEKQSKQKYQKSAQFVEESLKKKFRKTHHPILNKCLYVSQWIIWN